MSLKKKNKKKTSAKNDIPIEIEVEISMKISPENTYSSFGLRVAEKVPCTKKSIKKTFSGAWDDVERQLAKKLPEIKEALVEAMRD